MTTRKGLNHLGQSGATDGQVPVWNADTQEWEPGDQSSTPGGGGGARWEVLMASDGSGSPLVASNGDWLYGEAT